MRERDSNPPRSALEADALPLSYLAFACGLCSIGHAEKCSRARVSKPRGCFLPKEVPNHRRRPVRVERPGIEPGDLRVGLRRRGARKQKGCTLECGGREGLSRASALAGVGSIRRGVWARRDGACENDGFRNEEGRPDSIGAAFEENSSGNPRSGVVLVVDHWETHTRHFDRTVKIEVRSIAEAGGVEPQPGEGSSRLANGARATARSIFRKRKA